MKQQTSIERLVQWAFITEKLRFGGGEASIIGGGYVDSLVRLQRIHELGTIIQGGSPGGRYVASESADDAEAVGNAVLRLAADRRALVVAHGRAGTRPDWAPYAYHRFEPAWWTTEGVLARSTRCKAGEVPHGHRPGFWWEGGRKGKHRVYSTWTPVIEIDGPREIEPLRAAYTAWWLALEELGVMLLDHLENWSITEEMPPWNPWAPAGAARKLRETA